MQRSSCICLLIVCVYGGFKNFGQEQPTSTRVEPAQGRFHLHKGYRIHPFATHPAVVSPVAIAWDGSGAVWVMEEQRRVVKLTDFDADGLPEQRTIFAEGFSA